MNESIVRTLSGIIYIVLLLTATLYSPYSFVALFALFMLLSVFEFCQLARLKAPVPIVIALCGLGLFGYYVKSDLYTSLALDGGALFISVMLLADLFSKKPSATRDRQASTVILIGYIIIPFLLIIKLPFLCNAYNPFYIIGMFIIIWTNDTFAYIVGKTMGRHKLFERISPKKTIEGFAGGLIFALAGSFILSRFYTFFSPLTWMASAVIVVIFGTLGDLIESKLKRNAGVKDSGKIMPGHGGILDRLDSVIFAIPFLFLYYQIICYVS